MPHHKEERTLVIIKPDGLQRTLVGEVIKRYEQIGLKLIGMKMMRPSSAHIDAHYNLDPEWKKNVGEKSIKSYKEKGLTPPSNDPLVIAQNVIEGLKKYISAGPVVAMVWQGGNAVKIVRKVTGGTEPLTSDVGTIRGDYVLDSYAMADTDGRAVRNLIHASGSVKEAEDEIKHWFKTDELFKYELINEAILYGI
ncbi:MAG: nucleoside-diphosphate kinase [Candidatus Pacebacteria bacterium]|nr:nucleoside-diphosphate kinase [Candidatus Paceibacterota bacterium]MDD5357462.1 nucleoside-diphosphate kinase [Candidatus Paceibacterota bacterium]